MYAPLHADTVNGVKTAAVLAGLGGLLVAVGSIFGRGGALVGLVLGVAVAAGSWWFSDRLALAAAGAVPAERWAYPDHHRIVPELSGTLILADVGRKAQAQVRDFVTRLLSRHHPGERAAHIAATLSEGRWTHDFPINVEHARSLGLPVDTDLPDEVRQLMGLYPQPRGRRPSVEYIPSPYEPPSRPHAPRRPMPARPGQAQR